MRSQEKKRGNLRERGQSLVETAMLLPALLIIIIGIVEVADAFNAYVTLVDSARDGARLGSKGLASDDDIENLIITETGRLRDPVAAGDIDVDHVQVDGVDAISVEVCNDRTLILRVPWVLPEEFRMCSRTVMRVFPPQP